MARGSGPHETAQSPRQDLLTRGCGEVDARDPLDPECSVPRVAATMLNVDEQRAPREAEVKPRRLRLAVGYRGEALDRLTLAWIGRVGLTHPDVIALCLARRAAARILGDK